MADKPAVLYVSYDGMLEPLGQSQVIAYLEKLTDAAKFHILSFEKPADWADTERRAALERRLDTAGIDWHSLVYHKHPTVPATLFDIVKGTIAALWLALRHRVQIVHARSYIPALIGLVVKRITGAKLLFDMRGFWADERVDGGVWPKSGKIYRAMKRLERRLLLGADHIVTLTHASRPVIEAFPYLADRPHASISVIPTCADLDLFSPDGGPRPESYTLGHLGAISGNRMFDEVLTCFIELRKLRPDARLLVVNLGEHELARMMAREFGIPEETLKLVAAEHIEVPALIRQMNAGAAVNRPSFCEIARAPTRLAEYLGCGVPCLGNARVGDMESNLQDESVGAVISNFTKAERVRAVERLLELDADPETPMRCRAVALELFSLKSGVDSYRSIYRELST